MKYNKIKLASDTYLVMKKLKAKNPKINKLNIKVKYWIVISKKGKNLAQPLDADFRGKMSYVIQIFVKKIGLFLVVAFLEVDLPGKYIELSDDFVTASEEKKAALSMERLQKGTYVSNLWKHWIKILT